ncbi:MAG TPA: 3',5'-cyclic-nucleotide phosphodiesterase, partial [Segetibacter sp.]
LNKYRYVALAPQEEIPLENTGMTLTPFFLSHSNPYESTAFLLNNKGNYLLYLGDTGADSVEHSGKLATLWKHIAPLIKQGVLKGIFIEASFPDAQPDRLLFGHFTPKWLMHELSNLNSLTGNAALQKVPVIITHIKPSLDSETKIRQQLKQANILGLTLLYPKQGVAFQL